MLYRGVWCSESRSTTTMSARLPASSEPMSASMWRARAPSMVAIAKASSAEITFGSNVATLCNFAAVSISSHMSRSLFEAAPSVPSPTATPARSICGTGATPEPSFMFDCGL